MTGLCRHSMAASMVGCAGKHSSERNQTGIILDRSFRGAERQVSLFPFPSGTFSSLPFYWLPLPHLTLSSPPSNRRNSSSYRAIVGSRSRLEREREREREMTRVADSVLFDVANQLFHLAETIEKLVFPAAHPCDGAHGSEERGFVGVPIDILETPKGYTFLDIPGLSKADIHVTLEDEKMLVIKSSRKRKREEGEEEGCRYLLLERWGSSKFLRRFRLSDDSKSPTPLPSLPGARMECSLSSWRSFLRRPNPRPRP